MQSSPRESTSHHSSNNVESTQPYAKTIAAPTAMPTTMVITACPGRGGKTASADATYVSLGPYFPCEPDSPGLGAPFGASVPPPLMLDGAVDAGTFEVEEADPPLLPPPMVDVCEMTSVVLMLVT